MPNERINDIVRQLNSDVIIKKENILNIMKKENYKEIEKIFLMPNDIYYIMFTSGSTGIPKGVKITYKNLNSCINWLKDITKIENGVILNQANFTFDLSVADLYLSLLSNSEQFIISNTLKIDFSKTFEQLKLSNANMAVMTPSYAELLLLDKAFSKELMPNLQTILFCGEKLLKTTVIKLKERFDNLKIINSYGPTECTFAVTSIQIDKKFLCRDDIPVGIPKNDVKIYIVDENITELPNGKIGEIVITGESVGDGYLKEIENNPFIDYNKKKAYLTGDLGYFEDKVLYYVARKDKQVKFKGYRIELSDIENNLQKLYYIERAVVIAKKNNENKVQNIIAFVKIIKSESKTELQIKKDLQSKIPIYMCPKIKIVKEFPVNKNGKCDEKKLLEEL